MSRRFELVLLGLILLLFGAMSVVGITWGLPTRRIDPYLFGDDSPWPGEKIYRLAHADEKFSPIRAADVDADPLDRTTQGPVLLTGTEETVAKIYLRYRLFTHQPDEMISMMALAGMSPRHLRLDPKLYQYGGLFIYPVGALIKTCGILGLIEVRNDLIHYLDDPDEFGKFYVVARAYSAGWGLLGVMVVFGIARRLGGAGAGLLSALLFTLMPVTVCMAHEGKPHLPGAVLMLAAVLCAMRYLSYRAEGVIAPGHDASDQTHERNKDPRGMKPASQSQLGDPRGMKPAARRDTSESNGEWAWRLMCICCGGALGMVLSALPILVLIPLVAWGAARSWRAPGFNLRSVWANDNTREKPPRGLKPAARSRRGSVLRKTAGGLGLVAGIYLITNPYVAINAVVNREVLRSNFGNSLAMYEITHLWEGFTRVLELTVEGTTLPVVILGVVAFAAGVVRRKPGMIPLAAPALLFFVQFVLLGAGKPAEFGRFGIFTNTALLIGAACILCRRWGKLPATVNGLSGAVVALWTAFHGGLYLTNFHIDTTMENWRTASAQFVGPFQIVPETGRLRVRVAVLADPAPYGCPPLNFARTDVLLMPGLEQGIAAAGDEPTMLVRPVDRFPRSSLNKLLAMKLLTRDPLGRPGRTSPGSVPRPPRFRPIATPISWANKPILEEAPWLGK
jgi:hypothetical protein